MRIEVVVKPKAKKTVIEQTGDASFLVSVTEPPHDNEANFAVMDVLSTHFAIPLSRIRLIGGKTSRHKFFDIQL